MNNNSNNFSGDQYLLHCEQHQLPQSAAPSSNAVVMTSSSESTLIAYEAQICDAVRRRRSSKGSRRTTPTTLLNANPSNFRALVQKFTGRYTGIDVPVGRKGPVTLDFRSPASVSKEVIFPRSGDIQTYDRAIDRRVGNGESHVSVTMKREGKETASYNQMSQLSDCALYGGCGDHYAYGHHDNHHEDGDDLVREYLENSSFNGVDYMGYDDFYHDPLSLEEIMMRDLNF
ncbi:unnamed protein product, partial [Thlaspi arvense]